MKRGASLSVFADRLQSEGRCTFTRDEALAELGTSPAALRQAAARLARARRVVTPRRGFYVIVPIEHRVAGAPPPSWYIDDLLRHAGVRGYVGLLSAAALYGAAHHASQTYQVLVDRQLRPVTVGRSRLHFVFRRDVAAIPVTRRKTDTGDMPVSTPEATALDLVRYSDVAGGIDAVATVLSDLGEQLDPSVLARTAAAFPRSVAQRLGWLLDHLGHGDRTRALHETLEGSVVPVDLWPAVPADAAPDPRWRVRADREVEVDA